MRKITLLASLVLGLSGCDSIFGGYLRYEARDGGTDSGAPLLPFQDPISTDIPEAGDANLLTAADLDGDGRPELVVSRFNVRNAILSPGTQTQDPVLVYRVDSSGRAVPAPEMVSCGPLDRVQTLQPFRDGKTGISYVAINHANEIRFLQFDRAAGAFKCPVSAATGMQYTDVAVGDLTGDGSDDLGYYVAGCGTTVPQCMRFQARDPSTTALHFQPALSLLVSRRTLQVRRVSNRLDAAKKPFIAMSSDLSGRFQLDYIAKPLDAFGNLFPSSVNFAGQPGGMISANLDDDGYDDLVLLQTANLFSDPYFLSVFEVKDEPPGTGLMPKLSSYRPAQVPSGQFYGVVRAANLDGQGGDELVLALSAPPGVTAGSGTFYALRYTRALLQPPAIRGIGEIDAGGFVPALELLRLDPPDASSPQPGRGPDLVYLRTLGAQTSLTVRRATPGFAWQ
jgi:hypothetical protein